MNKNIDMNDYEECDEEVPLEIWDILTPEQKEEFKKSTEKNKDNLSYIG